MISVTRNIPLVSFSGNPMVIRVNTTNHVNSGDPRPNYILLLSIYDEDPDIGNPDPIHTDSIQVDNDGNGYFDISEIINPLLSPTFPWPLPVSPVVTKDTGATFEFWYTIREGYGEDFEIQPPEITSDKHYAIPGGLSDQLLSKIEDASSDQYTFLLANKLFLTNQPRSKRVTPDQPQITRFFNGPDELTDAKVIVTQHDFFTGNLSNTYIWEGTLEPFTLYNINISPGQAFTLNQNTDAWSVCVANDTYDLLLSEDNFLITDEDNVPIIICTDYNMLISELMNFRLTDLPAKNNRSLIFQNSMGGFDSVFSSGDFLGLIEAKENISFQPIKTTLRNSLLPIQERPQGTKIFSGSIGYLSNSELNWLQDLFLSEQVFLYQDNELYAAALQRDNFPMFSDNPPGSIEIKAVLGTNNFHSQLNSNYIFT